MSWLLTGCNLWLTPTPDPNCTTLSIEPERELVLSGAWLGDAGRARNEAADTLSFATRTARYDVSELYRVLDLPLPLHPHETPWRWLALVNRTDLADQPGSESPNGEARLVYTLTDGPADEAAPPLAVTAIIEYELGGGRSARWWTGQFHDLSGADSVVDLVEQLDGDLRVRLNDARAATSRLYELAPNAAGRLVTRGLRNTPRPELAGTPELAEYLSTNEANVRSGTHTVPNAWLANSASLAGVSWLPSDPELQAAFARGTCSGCHATDSLDGFHLRASASGVELSPFLNEEELPRRIASMRARLCQPLQ